MNVKLTMYTLLLILGSYKTYGQDTVFIKRNVNINGDIPDYRTDTVIFDGFMSRHLLIGTTILRNSNKNYRAENNGYYLYNLSASDCQKKEEKFGDNRVVSIIKTDTLWTAEINIYANCCYSFLGEIEIKNDTIINFIYHGYGTYCFCNCCFGLKYEMKREIFVNENNIEYFMINGEEKTLIKIE